MDLNLQGFKYRDPQTGEFKSIAGFSADGAADLKRSIEAETIRAKAAEDSLQAQINSYHSVVYGFHVDPNEADPSACVTYLESADGKTPAKMGEESFDYGSWKGAFFIPKPCVLNFDGTVNFYLDPDDYSKKEDGSDSNIDSLDLEGNVMIEWPLIWWKYVPGQEDGEWSFYVANAQIDEDYHCWCNYDCNDNIIPHFYTAAYNSVKDSTGRFRSVSGQTLNAASGNSSNTGAVEVTCATKNNTTDNVEWYTDVYADTMLLNGLHVLISKSLNTQVSFGRGLDTGGQSAKEAYVTGSMDKRGLFWGDQTGTTGVKTFGMENWWGCELRRTAGCMNVSNKCKVKLTWGTADGSTVVGYNSTGNGYLELGTVPSSGYVKKFSCVNGVIYPSATGGDSSTYYADYLYLANGTFYLARGGRSGRGLGAGAFYFHLSFSFSHSYWVYSAALSCKPAM